MTSDLLLSDESGALALRRWRLLVVSGPDRGNKVDLESDTALIGASPGAILVLTDDTVSRYHAEVDVYADGLRVRDLDSTNGTYIRGDTPVRAAFVEHGGSFRVGESLIQLIAIDQPHQGGPDTDPQIDLQANQALQSLVARSRVSHDVIDRIDQVSRCRSNVLFAGPRGSGRATAAEITHRLGHRTKAIVRVDGRSATVDSITESFIHAHRGGLLVENCDQLEHETQMRLRTLIETGIAPDNPSTRQLDVRLYSTSIVELEKVPQFDARLARRLSVLVVNITQINDRPEDLIEIAQRTLAIRAPDVELGDRTKEVLTSFTWNENIDELSRAMTGLFDAPGAGEHPLAPRVQSAFLSDLITSTRGDVSAAAEMIGFSDSDLYRYLRAHRVELDDL